MAKWKVALFCIKNGYKRLHWKQRTAEITHDCVLLSVRQDINMRLNSSDALSRSSHSFGWTGMEAFWCVSFSQEMRILFTSAGLMRENITKDLIWKHRLVTTNELHCFWPLCKTQISHLNPSDGVRGLPRLSFF